MPQFGNILRDPIWQAIGAIFTLAGIFVGVFLATRDIIWLFSILWVGLLFAAIILCIVLRAQVSNHQPTSLRFYSMCFGICLICVLFGLSLIGFGDLRIIFIPAPTSTPTSMLTSTPTHTPTATPTVTQSTPTPTSIATQGDLLETWAYRTRLWEGPALTYPNVELSVVSQPDTHPSYEFAYQFPSTTTATYAAFNFELFQTPDLSAYESVQIKYRLSDDKTSCYIGFADNEGHDSKKTLPGVRMNDWFTTTFLLDDTFPEVNRHAVTQVIVFADNPGDGSVHKCIINEIRFLKP